MAHYPKLQGERCYLAPAAAEDAPLWARWLADLDVALPLGDEAYAVLPTESQVAAFEAMTARGSHVFTIVDRATDAAVGRCLLFAVNPTDRTAEAGIFVGERDYRGKGLGTEAMRLLLDYAFNLLNLGSVMIGVYDFNAAAVASYRKLGFREIGRRRRARTICGRPYDLVLMDMLDDEFLSPCVGPKMAELTAPKPG